MALLAAPLASAFTITVDPSSTKCYYEDLVAGNSLTVSFEVGEGGQHDIDFSMMDATGRILHAEPKKVSGFYTLTADREGKYTYCFNNQMSMVTSKVVSFFVHENHRPKKEAKDDGATDPLANEIRQLTRHLQEVRDAQSYIVIRERMHRDTAESTNSRVKWWSFFQVILLATVCFFQISYLKRFFEVKRLV
ncbi:putative COPII-coated vesicle protein [Piptocephalis cylindrospora]|uniref:Putative COPII-coated vesicle protein n=1 Tax=Piptocephalis cylindrospora TaxID=1907219 RepID=A0A4P9Y5D7_9FUNG|nr:putative COPII-coated vesicle protein [Piptocephalis cylindrospora]|eukprot:RKP13000.1 putative COPII-coated vesicle protein [Piptocephalis cylindrospora]